MPDVKVRSGTPLLDVKVRLHFEHGKDLRQVDKVAICSASCMMFMTYQHKSQSAQRNSVQLISSTLPSLYLFMGDNILLW